MVKDGNELDGRLSSTSARRPGRPRANESEERRRAILAAARQSFVELGFARTTTAEVAARAKVSKRAIYEAFTNRTELFAEVIRDCQHLIVDLPRPEDEELPLLDTLIRIFRLDLDDDAERAREAMLNLIVRESTLLPELSDYLYENGALRSREALIEWLLLESARGRISVDDPLVDAGMLMDMVFGALLPRRRSTEATDRMLRRDHIKKRLAIYLRGIGADPLSG
ncbi:MULTISPECIES: TetR/AcrR family transcriptional regulator [unclassified Caballeronia]|uniref:TetR/AcrR family transcriptional regulator n=1 Tax=unclassified Caballeronia TaxID=2646786 RepID=UPI001588BF18|nr:MULTISPECIES: TetR/AcrR family transcriptional regulator [unclassified Caballeronia]QSN64328.1 TetR/AcrR family transcriptional regulator [Caballeronia sp. M1242]